MHKPSSSSLPPKLASHDAGWIGKIDVLKDLMDRGVVTPSSTTLTHKSLLHEAAAAGDPPTPMRLKSAKRANSLNGILWRAVVRVLMCVSCTGIGQLEVVKFLISQGHPVNAEDSTGSLPVARAAQSGGRFIPVSVWATHSMHYHSTSFVTSINTHPQITER